MAAVVITAANVVAVESGKVVADGIAGATITAGQVLYIDTGDANKLKLADANGTALQKAVAGIALHGAAANQPIRYQTAGSVDIGGTVAAGVFYCIGQTAGSLVPHADLLLGDNVVLVCYGVSTSRVKLAITDTGVAI